MGRSERSGGKTSESSWRRREEREQGGLVRWFDRCRNGAHGGFGAYAPFLFRVRAFRRCPACLDSIVFRLFQQAPQVPANQPLLGPSYSSSEGYLPVPVTERGERAIQIVRATIASGGYPLEN